MSATYTSLASRLKDPSLLQVKGHINGKWVDATSGKSFDVHDPSTGQVIATCPNMDERDSKLAVEAAKKAFPSWAKKTGKERQALMNKWYDLMVSNSEDLATILSAECGKPLAEGRGEIVYGSSFIQWFGEEAKRVYGDVIPPNVPGRRIVVIKQPVGVCGLITPWNFPNSMLTRKAGAALAAGCTIVAKPAPETPLSTLVLCELAIRAGIPDGVVNAVVCDRETTPKIGTELCTNPDVKKISFTGSTAVGKLLMQQCSSSVKKVSLELGGNAPFIVFDDADIDTAVQGAMASKFRNTGQTCVCTNRFYVQSGVYDEFVKKLSEKVSKLKVGGPFDVGVEQGPLVNQIGLDKVQRHVNDAKALGAKIVTGGKPHDLGLTFFQPTVLADMKPEMIISKEETFGPIAAVYKFETEEEAIKLANDTEFGLAGYFYSQDMGRIWRVSEALEYGMVGINCGIISTEVAPFGGVKSSGLGREGSKYGIDEYLEVKYLAMDGIGAP